MARVLELQLQHQSFQCIFRVDFLGEVSYDMSRAGTVRVHSQNGIKGSYCCVRTDGKDDTEPSGHLRVR